jgi:hypothetical protein
MATFNKIDQFVADCANGVHNLGSDTPKVMLTNSAPLATNTVKADITEISPGNGYTAGGAAVTINSSSQVGGVYTLDGDDVTITATGGSIGPFRYAVLYNATPTSPAGPLIGWWDYGSSVTLGVGEKFDVVFPSSDILSVT